MSTIALPRQHHRPWCHRTAVAAMMLLLCSVTLVSALRFLLPSLPSRQIVAGQVQDFSPGSVTSFLIHKFHLVRLEDGSFLALSTRDPSITGNLFRAAGGGPDTCPIRWYTTFLSYGPIFRMPCYGWSYDMAGHRIFGGQPRDMDRYPVTLTSNGAVVVDTTTLLCGTSLYGEYPVGYCQPPE
jgi:hypothetical protein